MRCYRGNNIHIAQQNAETGNDILQHVLACIGSHLADGAEHTMCCNLACLSPMCCREMAPHRRQAARTHPRPDFWQDASLPFLSSRAFSALNISQNLSNPPSSCRRAAHTCSSPCWGHDGPLLRTSAAAELTVAAKSHGMHCVFHVYFIPSCFAFLQENNCGKHALQRRCAPDRICCRRLSGPASAGLVELKDTSRHWAPVPHCMHGQNVMPSARIQPDRPPPCCHDCLTV